MKKYIEISDIDLQLYKNISKIDFYFAKKILEFNDRKELNGLLFILSLMLSNSVSMDRHTCLDLNNIELLRIKLKDLLTSANPKDPDKEINLPAIPDDIIEIITKCNVVGKPSEYQPIILDSRRLYLQKYWHYEQKIAKRIVSFSRMEKFPVDIQLLSKGLNRIFPISSVRENSNDWQRVAAFTAVINPFCIITGGPGTGKTTVVAAVLSLLQEQAFFNSGKFLKIQLCAPTGKAAARMSEAVFSEKERMKCSDEILESIPADSSTIHRLMGSKYLSQNFKHNSKNKLNMDVLVIDEASMVPMILMSKLLDAVSDHTKIILLGDKNQLASVEAGAVFTDICDVASNQSVNQNLFSEKFTTMYSQTENSDKLHITSHPNILSDLVVELTDSYRFDPEKGIGKLKEAVNLGNADNALEIITKEFSGEVIFKALSSDPKKLSFDLSAFIKNLTLTDSNIPFLSYLKAKDIAEAFEIFNEFRVLCAHKVGLWGTDKVNTLLVNIIKRIKNISPKEIYFKGLPLLIKSNHSSLNLFNGDVGLCWTSQDNSDNIVVYFPDNSKPGKFRTLLPAQLPEHETVFAMTVHKSQGSGFENVLLLLSGNDDSQGLTRELVYTGITRAKKSVAIWSSESAFKKGISSKTVRVSGIIDKL